MSGRVLWASAWFALAVAVSTARADADTGARIAQAALTQVGVTTAYDPAYRRLAYPDGDVPIETGVCADVLIRALRKVGIDLQHEVHLDIKANFRSYPALWGLSRPDRNIDHRRVPNLRRWFERHGWSQKVSDRAGDYRAGDVVSWRLDNGRPHIGVVSSRMVPGSDRRLVVHNIALGALEEDVLFAWTVSGHYRMPDAANLTTGR